MSKDNRHIGSLLAAGFSVGTMPIVAGMGAYAGARGIYRDVTSTSTIRQASMAEDPSMRRINGGGKGQFILEIVPTSRPEVIVSAAGPVLFHGPDFIPITVDKPAQKGETVILYAKGLGPTFPEVKTGDPFSENPLAVVISPVEVLVDGQAATVVNQVGVPGEVGTYRVDFQVPDTAASGMVSIQLSAAWVLGTAVRIPVR